MMLCKKCGGKTRAYYGVASEDGMEYRRYRRCPKCLETYVTLEIMRDEVKRLRMESEELKDVKKKVVEISNALE